MSARAAIRLTATGRVQGVGFRPGVFRLAEELGLAGSVQNTARGVVIELEGPPGAVRAFVARLPGSLPCLARLDGLREEPLAPAGRAGFAILPSEEGAGEGRALIPFDVATCPACLRELRDPADRRHRYPFINCTLCGPRYTIIESVPYDRPRTSMKKFPLCARCRREYEDPRDRRHHAQPNACPECGPRLTLTDPGGRPLGGDPLEGARERLRAGQVLAVRGVGGFHLAVDACSAAAVERLRRRKRRGGKPFAVLAPDLEAVRRLAAVSPAEAALLEGERRPIVLLGKRRPFALADGVAPGNPRVGAMLPHAPLHHLLVEGFAALVLTSGNLSEEPLARDNDEALQRLGGLADAFLLHDRDILMSCDDSVACVRPGRAGEDALSLVRRSRGYAPDPLPFPGGAACVLGVGGQQKNTFCLTRGERAFLSQHVGDLENLETEAHFRRCLAHLEGLLGVEPELVACDLHPDYLSTRLAEELVAARSGSRLVRVQHHHAHLGACLAEHELTGPALGLCLDGTGYGPDGTIWGGELLLGDLREVRRVARLRPFRLPGGEAAVREPWRTAAGALLEALGEGAPWGLLGPEAGRAELVARAAGRGVNSPWTSSLGRLFDAVSALLGLCRRQDYDAQAAVVLEAAAGSLPGPAWEPALRAGPGLLELDFAPMLRELVAGLGRGAPPEELAAGFHAWAVAGLARVCREARAAGAPGRVAL
ncbi:MAG TPA: carbamoyltransferase HypF, partial [Myxococcota bacterium]|nr:carbamoyltransferase HypF [Myxococcota bacterium]